MLHTISKVRFFSIVLLFVVGTAILFLNGYNPLGVLFSAGAFGAYSLLYLLSSFSNKPDKAFTKQSLVIIGLLFELFLFLYAFQKGLIEPQLLAYVLIPFVLGVAALLVKKRFSKNIK